MKKSDDRLLFLPLGGSGEIGMNLNLYAHKGKWLMVDCGMSFADEHFPGVDLVFPDPTFIEREKGQLLGLVVTHGHEDHIGAIPHIWRRFECPIYATPFTAALITDKLAEASLLDEVQLHIVEHDGPFELGPFTISYLALAHSTAEGHGLVIETGKGTIFHTGDWKLDPNPLIGPICPSTKLKTLGDKGVLAMVGDSTNVFNPENAGSELAVRESLIDICKDRTGRIVLTTFASNVARLDTAGEVAKATGRHIVLLGRSMQRITKAAKATGYLKNFPDVLNEEDASHIPRDKILILCTGCQGENRAALARIARNDHKHLTLAADDTVIFSSKIIPGNELVLGQLFNTLASNHIRVITEKDAFVHVSGHPGQADLKDMYGWVRPHIAIPVHGEARHLIAHAALARSAGIGRTIVPANGDIIEIEQSGARKIDEAPVGRMILDGDQVIPADSPAMGDRRRASQQGFITASIVLEEDGELAAEPRLAVLGLPTINSDIFYDKLLGACEIAMDRMKPKQRLRDDSVEEVVRVSLRRLCRSTLGKNPGVAVLISRLEDEHY